MHDLPVGRVEVPPGVGSLYTFEGRRPTIAADAWVAPTAAVIGDVSIGAQSGIWFHCVLRGDTNFIRVGCRVNIQDGTIIHVNPGNFPTIIEDDVTIGHAAIVHACTLRARAFVAMGATVLDGAVIEAGGMLAAGSVLPPGKIIGPNEMWMGAPAKLKRVLAAEERAEFDRIAVHYAEQAARFARGLRPA